MIKIVPLKSSFMFISIVGFFVSWLLIWPAERSFGMAFMIVFAAMFIASLISMTFAPIEEATPMDTRSNKKALHVDQSARVAPKKAVAKKKPARKKPAAKKTAKKSSKRKTAKKSTKKKAAKKTAKKKSARRR